MTHLQAKYSLVEKRQELRGTRRVAPIAHQLARDREHRENVHPSGAHAVVGVFSSPDVERPRGVAVGVHGVAGLAERQREERSAYLSVHVPF